MGEIEKPVQDVISDEIRRRQKILEELHRKIYKRVVELKLLPGETIARIKQVDGVLVEFEKRP